jgi:hypothetical protein
MNQLLAYALVFIALEIILLVTIRNHYIPLIACVIALVGVEGLLLTMIWHGSLLVRQHLLESILVLLFVDVIILLSIWPFISGLPNPENDKAQMLNPVGWLLYASSIITTKWFRVVLFLLLIWWCIISGVRSCQTFPDG